MRVTGIPQKLSALFEVVGVFVLGNFLAGQIGTWRGRSLGEVLQPALQSTPPDWVAASRGWLEIMGINYACLLLPAIMLGWWRRRTKPAYYGLTRSGHPVSHLALVGLAAVSLVGLGFPLLNFARQVFSLGPHPGLLDSFMNQPWTLEFWLFLSVASFGFQPMIEELFFRGYLQTRLEEAYGSMGAIAIVSVLVALGHNQYHQLTVMGVGTIAALLIFNVGVGFVYWRYRSLLPTVIMHGLINLPTKGYYEWIALGTTLVLLVVFRRAWLTEVRKLFDALRATGWKAQSLFAALLIAGASIGFETSPRLFAALATLGLLAALLIEARDRSGHAISRLVKVSPSG